MKALLRPFAALRPLPQYAQAVAAPPYDVLSSAEALEMAKDKPLSFLHISKPEIDLPQGTDPYSQAVYDKGAENLKALIQKGVLKQDDAPSYYIYQMQEGDHVQTGLVAVASCQAYDDNEIRKHELTRPDKEQDRVNQIHRLNCQSSPVLLTCKPSAEFEEITDLITLAIPDAEVVNERAVIHRLWRVVGPPQIAAISELFNGPESPLNRLYIADGHHRSAAATRVMKMKKEKNPNHYGGEAYNYFLSVIYPANQMKILDYNRVVKDLGGMSPEELLDALSQSFKVTPAPGQVKPAKPGQVGMFLKDKWYQLEIKPGLIPPDPVEALDVSLLYQHVLRPLLGIENQRTDKRIDFVGGARGLGELEKRVKSGEMAVAFAMYPTQMEQIIQVADAEGIMPPKSTWFEPKLIDGLVSYPL